MSKPYFIVIVLRVQEGPPEREDVIGTAEVMGTVVQAASPQEALRSAQAQVHGIGKLVQMGFPYDNLDAALKDAALLADEITREAGMGPWTDSYQRPV